MDAQRKRNLEEIFGPISETYFSEIYKLSKQITDYGVDEDAAMDEKKEEDATGVAVVFEEASSDEDEGHVYELDDVSDGEKDDELDQLRKSD
jgi:hypothetical protein